MLKFPPNTWWWGLRNLRRILQHRQCFKIVLWLKYSQNFPNCLVLGSMLHCCLSHYRAERIPIVDIYLLVVIIRELWSDTTSGGRIQPNICIKGENLLLIGEVEKKLQVFHIQMFGCSSEDTYNCILKVVLNF